MAIDTNKLAALVEEQNQNPLASMPELGVDDAEMPPEEGEEDVGEDGEAILSEMGEFGEMLKENADVIVPIAEEIGEDLAGDSTYQPETEEAVVDAVDRMPTEMSKGMAENLSDRPLEELNAVGKVLVEQVDSEETPAGEASPMEAEKVGGLLEVAATVETVVEEDEDDDDEMEEDVEDEMADEEEIAPAVPEGGM